MGFRKGTKRGHVLNARKSNNVKRRKKGEGLEEEGLDCEHVIPTQNLKETSEKGTQTSECDFEVDGSMNDEESNVLPELVVELEPPPPERDPGLHLISGNIVVNANHFIVACRNLERHKCGVSSSAFMQLCKVRKVGLITVLKFKCNKCDHEETITSEKCDKLLGGKKSPGVRDITLNEKAVWGSLSIGIGCTPLEELLSVMDISSMSPGVFAKHEEYLGNKWEQILYEQMEQAIKEEIDIARCSNPPRVIDGNIPWTIVIIDGGWCQRSFGHRYTAKSGCAVIIGFYTKKILFLGIRNKYCTVCARAQNKCETPERHKCYKNWDGSSTAMESDIIVEGFRFCEKEYGIRFLKFVGDGDSSVYFNITSNVSYGRCVEKIDCANHLVKNFTKRLHILAKGTNMKFLSTPRINMLSKTVRKIISTNNGDEQMLAKDINNATDHVFGCHSNCRQELCEKSGLIMDPCALYQFPNDLLIGIRREVSRISSKSHVLVMNMTSNNAESFMALVAKFSGGKQVNRSQQGSYKRRVTGAGLNFQLKYKWHGHSLKRLTGVSPKQSLKRFMSKKERKQSACRKRLHYENQTKELSLPHGDKDYGLSAKQPAAKGAELKKLMDDVLSRLAVTNESRMQIEVATRQQADCNEWKTERSERLTASNFGVVCKMRPTTLCKNMVSLLLNQKPVKTAATEYGKVMESVAIAQYETDRNIKVSRCGLFVDLEFPYLAASPDGLISDDGLLEIKCPYTLKDMDPQDLKSENVYGTLVNGQLNLNENHNYYYQVQGQLHITERQWCDFVIWSPKGYAVQKIFKDDLFWKTKMIEKLKQFYLTCLLPEIADPCRKKGLPIREPKHILEAREKAGAKKRIKEGGQK